MERERFSIVVPFTDGLNEIQFRGWDVAGNGPVESDVYKVRVDTKGPEFRDFIGSPSGIDGYDVTVVVTDTLAGLDTTKVYYRHTHEDLGDLSDWIPVIVSQVQQGFVIRFLLSTVEGGDHILVFRASDLAGNEGQFTSPPLWVNTPPFAVIDSPLNGSTHYEDEPLILDANGSMDPDGGPLEFKWSVWKDGEIVEEGEGRTPSVLLSPGAYGIRLTVTDERGSEAVDEVHITVVRAPTPSAPDGISNAFVILVVFIICLMVILGSFWYLRARKG